LLVVEPKGNNITQIRHAVTLDTGNVSRSELSVVRAKHKVLDSLKKTVEDQIIGRVVADNNAPLVIRTVVGGVLSTMVDDGDIVNFANVQAKTLSTNPTIVEIRFSYTPAFPINYISMNFAIDLSTGTLNLSSTTAGGING
jgi:hypothetical protein